MAEILSEFGHLVGLAGGNNIQATTMPIYSSVPLGTIVQYIGTTTADYINGYFYKATATGWEQHDTQPASNADNSITAFKESSPALAAHAVDDYIRYNNVTYIVTSAIAIGDNLVIGTNIAVPTLDEGTVIYTPETGGGSVISADMVGYDNTTSELEATNTQNAIDEVVDIVADKVDKVSSATNGNLAGLDANGNLTDAGWSADKTTSNASGNPISISGLKSNQLSINPVVTLEPIQDLHGQSNPYPAGGGKNLIPLIIENIKYRNQEGTWSGNTFTPSGSNGTITIVTDAANNVTGFKINGTFSSNIVFNLSSGWYRLSKGISYIINGGSIPVSVRITDNITNTYADYSGAGTTFTLGNDFGTPLEFLYIHAGTWSNVISKPMIRLATETDATFAPYENICPISGYDKIEIESCGKNLVCKTLSSTGIYGGSIASDSNYDMHIAPIVKGTTYYISTEDNVNWFAGFFTSMPSVGSSPIDNSWIHTPSFTAPITGYVAFRSNHGYATPQCELGTSATTYEPYHKTTDLSLQLGQTIYGGTLDVEKGILTVDRRYAIFDGSSDETWMVYDSSLPVYLCTIGGTPEFASSPKHVISDKFKYVYAVWDNYTNPWCFSDHPLVENTYYSVDPSVIHNETEMRNWLANNPVTVIRYLATPYTIQLTPHEISLLKDYAYVSTNGTSMSFDYHNGEMASLGDVAQLGQTVNELGEKVVTQHIESFYISIAENQSSWQPITPTTTLQHYPVRDFAVMAFNLSNGQVMNIYVKAIDKTLYNLGTPLGIGDWQVVVSYNSI